MIMARILFNSATWSSLLFPDRAIKLYFKVQPRLSWISRPMLRQGSANAPTASCDQRKELQRDQPH